jgi:hypothetical protein
MIRLSASFLPRAEQCPASATLPGTDRVREDAEAGKRDHARMEATAPEGSMAEVAFVYNVLTGEAREVGRGLRRAYGKLAEGEIPGTTDLVTVEPDLVRVRDYKTGFGYLVAAPRNNMQLQHNALCAALVYGKQTAIVEVDKTEEEGEPERATFTAFDFAVIRARLRRIWDATQELNPAVVEGPYCWRCPAFSRCPAKTHLALALSTGQAPQELPTLELTPEAVARGWDRLKAAKRLLGEIEAIYRGFAKEHRIALGGGKMLGFVSRQVDELDGPTVFKVLREMHGEEVARAAVEMDTSKAALERALKLIAPPRGKARMVREALAAIGVAGGIKKQLVQRVEEYQEGPEALEEKSA